MAKIKFVMNRLLQDNIRATIEVQGIMVHYKVLSNQAFQKELNKKLAKELAEAHSAKSIDKLLEEIGDLLEVIYNLLESLEVSKNIIEKKRLSKQIKKNSLRHIPYCFPDLSSIK